MKKRDNILVIKADKSNKTVAIDKNDYVDKMNKLLSFEFKDYITSVKLEEDYILISLDVVSLFTNVPQQLVHKALEEKWHIIENRTSIPKKEFIELVDFCLF